MASIVNDPNGRKRILFIDGNGKRRPLRLGKVDRKTADSIRVHIERLLVGSSSRQPVPRETAEWVGGIGDDLHAKLAAAGLVAPRQNRTLAAWLDGYLEERSDLKPRTLTTLRVTREKLTAFFGDAQPMRGITREQASAWRAKMTADGLAVATVRLYSGNARQFFGEAARRGVVDANVFDHLQAGTTASKNDRYVTADEAGRVLAEITDPTVKLLFALARYAALRIPSEARPLTWGDVDWHRGRLKVTSPKTERHEGKERREVPITPRLAAVLQAAYDAAAEGATTILPETRGMEYVRNRVLAAIEAAGVRPWEDLFRTLRSSCEKEWAMTFPQYAVSRWVGHSITVSGKHYANSVPDELFEQAAQKAAQQAAADNGTERKPQTSGEGETSETPGDFRCVPSGADGCHTPVKTEGFGPSSRRP